MPMDDHETDEYTLLERFLIILMVVFAFALGFALRELDAVARELRSSLAPIASIGEGPF